MDFLSLVVLAVLAVLVMVNLGKILTGIIKLAVRLFIAGGALYLGYLIYTGQLQFGF